jgi:hypothetical protein
MELPEFKWRRTDSGVSFVGRTSLGLFGWRRRVIGLIFAAAVRLDRESFFDSD